MTTSRTLSMHMHRTGTMPVSLPKIQKLNVRQSRYNTSKAVNRSSFHIASSRAKHSHSFIDAKSPYTTRVKQQVLDENEYPYIETGHIQKQQIKLKQLLKSFNQQTVAILQKYVIDKPIKREYVKRRPQKEQLHFVREKETQNSSHMIILMKKEIQKLQSRCEYLNYTSKDEFEHKIKQLKQDKQRIIVENKDISRQITLNGLEMVKGKQSQVKELQYEQFLIESKRDRLKKHSESLLSQLNSLQLKTNQINKLIDRYEQQESYTLRQQEVLQREKSQRRLREQYEQKKRMYEHVKVITQSNNYQLKHKYFQKLKQLDQTTNLSDQKQKRNLQLTQNIQKNKSVIAELQQKLTLLTTKRNKSTHQNHQSNIPQTNTNKINLNFDYIQEYKD